MRSLRLLLPFLVSAGLASAAVFTWNGAAGDHNYTNPANWAGGAVPPNDGSATLVFGNAADTTVSLPLVLNVAGIQFQNTPAATYTLNASFLTLLFTADGITATGGGTERINSNITLGVSGDQTFSVASGTLDVAGGLIGSGNLVKTGAGELRVEGVSLLTGNATVNSGALVFANVNALPTGSISAGSGGYVGAENATILKSMLAQLDGRTFSGTIGLDTAPGSATAVYTDQIDLTGLTGYGGVGSATTARLTGNLRVASNEDYRFSGGAGTLYVQTNLTNAGSGLTVSSLLGQPLTVVLQGSNNFGGAVNVRDSILVLDSQQAVSPGKLLTIAGPGYIGETERFGNSTSGFLSLLHTTSPSAIAGFDSTDVDSPRTISTAIDLSVGGTRSDPYYLGTSTRVTLSGAITPTVGDSLYLTAVKGGYLTVASSLGGNIPGLVVGQSGSFDPQGGTVELTNKNTYSGGTQVLGGTLRVSNSGALGSGAVSVGTGATLDVNSGTTVANSLALASGARLSGNGALANPGGVTFGPGSILSPGGLGKVGALTFTTSLTLGPGSVYEFDLKDPSAGPGTGWDVVSVGNQINLSATAVSPITISLNTLTAGGATGLVSGFDANESYAWLFLTGNISGFSADQFTFDTSNFANVLNGGSFLVTQGNAGLSISFTPVPEPSTWVLLSLGLACAGLLEFRCRRK